MKTEYEHMRFEKEGLGRYVGWMRNEADNGSFMVCCVGLKLGKWLAYLYVHCGPAELREIADFLDALNKEGE